MRCSRSVIALWGPSTMENGTVVAGNPQSACAAKSPVFAEQLVEAVFDLGLASVVGVVFGDGPVLRLVGDGGAGEHIVADCVAEELHHDVDVFGVVRRHVVHTVPFGAAEHCPELLVIGAVGDQSADRVGDVGFGAASIAYRDLVALADQFVHEGQAVELGATHHQDSHDISFVPDRRWRLLHTSSAGGMVTSRRGV